MSSLIKSQQKSSSTSIQKLKIVKKSSVNSAAVNHTTNEAVSVDRASLGVDSNMSAAEKSRIAGISNFSRGDYNTS